MSFSGSPRRRIHVNMTTTMIMVNTAGLGKTLQLSSTSHNYCMQINSDDELITMKVTMKGIAVAAEI